MTFLSSIMLFLFYLTLFSLCSGKTVVMETKKVSVRKHLIKTGNVDKYLEAYDKQRVITSNSATGTQPFTNYYNDFYLAEVSIGTPAQTFNLVMDTGSSDLWVMGINCTQAACHGDVDDQKNQFDYQKSATFKTLNKPFAIQYGSGSCKGSIGSDKVTFASFVLAKQDIGVAYQISEVFGLQPMDGIFGMGWPLIAATTTTPPMQNLISQGQLDQPLFTVFMAREDSANQGRITYGGFDSTFCDGQVNYVILTEKKWWTFKLDAFSVSKYSYKASSSAISDTGTSFIGAPQAVVDGVVKQIGASYDSRSKLYTVSCSKQKSGPSLYFTINGLQYDIDPIDYIIDLDLGNNKCAVTLFAETSTGFAPTFTLGDTFIRGFCNVYDIGQSRIGFARASSRGPPRSAPQFSIVSHVIMSAFLYYVFH